MLMHAPVLFTLHAYVTAQDHSRFGVAKFAMGPKGQFPTPQSQASAFEEVLSIVIKPGGELRPMTKPEFLSRLTGEPSVTYGGSEFVPFQEGMELLETDLHGPVSLEMEIYITSGEQTGIVTVDVGERGRYASQAYLKAELDKVLSELPEGFRPMNKREFFQALMAKHTGGITVPVAVPGAPDFEPLF
ncbi:hypothetical protein ACOTHJ_12490 [Achromobacter xylosoxidans]|uniref:hypothetical protein n=1 Tax=Achromobacter anxifer TaxID=1287737 RepID=UPI001591F871|nr:hypothetical protein [Achromobacter anxifer]